MSDKKQLTQLGKDLLFLIEVLEEFSKTHGLSLSASSSESKDLVSVFVGLNGMYPEINKWIGKYDNKTVIEDVFYE